MKRLVSTVSCGLAVFVLPATAVAATPTRQHRREYRNAYRAVQKKFGHRAPGRQILRWGEAPSGRPASDAQILASLRVLDRMLAPPPPPVVITPDRVAPTYLSPPTVYNSTPATAPTPAAPVAAPVAAAPTGSLAACIIARESGGNPQATNGIYGGIGQWQQSTWLADGGGRYSSSPTGASYSQQAAILNGEGQAGMQQQQAAYDGC